MFELILAWWPHILVVLSVIMGTAAAVHATMTKLEVRSALGWVGVILLSPVVGAVIYAIAGINRIRRSSIATQRARSQTMPDDSAGLFDVDGAMIESRFGRRFAAMKTLGDRVSRHPMSSGNMIDLLETGDEAYAAMIAAIGTATRSVLLETYIFDRDRIGRRFVEALSDAVARGVEVRVLIDAVGARYSVPSVRPLLEAGGVNTRVFNGKIITGLRLPYANLRTHRKILVVDGRVAFTGGMNIREGFTAEFAGENYSRDTHFRVSGLAVADLFMVAAVDWHFTTGERLEGPAWAISPPQRAPGSPLLARISASGPDKSLETAHKMLMGAFSVARSSILIMSPYFLPDRELISALITAARRGVEVDIVVPEENNLALVDLAMTAQFDQLLGSYCRIWRAGGAFDHSKLLVVDERWAWVGSSNLDPRSLRLNFEVDMEVLDTGFAGDIATRILAAKARSKAVDLARLRNRPFAMRLVERVLWLASPYL